MGNPTDDSLCLLSTTVSTPLNIETRDNHPYIYNAGDTFCYTAKEFFNLYLNDIMGCQGEKPIYEFS